MATQEIVEITKASPPAVPVFRVGGSDVAANASQDQQTACAQNRREFLGWYKYPVMCVKLNVLHEIFSSASHISFWQIVSTAKTNGGYAITAGAWRRVFPEGPMFLAREPRRASVRTPNEGDEAA
ncbi:hypothetical protein MKX08_008536 [Trichoderma sp. CBMAI-0020]|nr:hypothetical protein MKX08_008536 [Trichoderma sp. CBMAI-0020]